jgi:hypothetical protein
LLLGQQLPTTHHHHHITSSTNQPTKSPTSTKLINSEKSFQQLPHYFFIFFKKQIIGNPVMGPPTTSPSSHGHHPTPDQPLTVRLMNLAQTLQFAWFLGHLTLLLTTLRYTFCMVKFSWYTKTATLSYRLAFMSAAITYGIVVYKAYRARIRASQMPTGQQGIVKILGDENVQYLLMALVWLYSKAVFFALFPFAVYSTFHFLTYTRTNLIPVLMPTATGAPPPSISETLGKFVKNNYDGSMHLVANLEILLWVRIALYCLVFKNSWILLVIYTLFLRARYSQSIFVRDAFKGLQTRGDAVIVDTRVPEGLKSAWSVGKTVVKRFGEVSDVGKMLSGGAATAPKKE